MPNITEQTPRSDIKIQDIIFSCPRPYAEGMTLTAGEAQALNQTFAENIRNNTAALVKQRNELQEKADRGEDVNGSKVKTDEELKEEFEEYATTYQFGVRSARGVTVSANPVEREARRIAMEQIKNALKAKNISIKSVDDEKMEALVSQLAGQEAVLTEARRRVESIKDVSLDALDLGSVAAARSGPNSEPAKPAVEAAQAPKPAGPAPQGPTGPTAPPPPKPQAPPAQPKA